MVTDTLTADLGAQRLFGLRHGDRRRRLPGANWLSWPDGACPFLRAEPDRRRFAHPTDN
jgi:hypothetical protein